jgi:hypothetical protein
MNIEHPSEILLRRAAEQHFTGQVERPTSNSPQASKHLSASGGSNVESEKDKEKTNIEHPPAMHHILTQIKK